MKIRPAYKLAAGAVLGGAALYGLWVGYQAWRVSRIDYPPIAPGRVNLVAITPGIGYRIIVSNQIAQLAEVVGGDFTAPDRPEQEGDVQNARRIPIRDLLRALQGEEEAVSNLVTVLNDLARDDLPPVPVIWEAEDLRRALDGDPELRRKLERDINVRLDGTPPEEISVRALIDGIVIRSPVPVRVLVAGRERIVTGHILENYRPRLMLDVERHFKERFDMSNEQIRNYYRLEAKRVLEDPSARENVERSLRARIDPERLRGFAERPERLLRNASIVVNDRQIEGASYSSYEAQNGRKMHNLAIRLTPEGRERLWKYSFRRRGFQLLLVVDGIAIAAPRISHALSGRSVTITQIPDEQLVRDSVDIINQLSSKGDPRS